MKAGQVTGWVDVLDLAAIAPGQVVRFDHGGRSFVLVRAPEGEVFALDGLCTHARAHLADGWVEAGTLTCPQHEGRFDYRTGAAVGRPACSPLATYPVRVESGRVLVRLG